VFTSNSPACLSNAKRPHYPSHLRKTHSCAVDIAIEHYVNRTRRTAWKHAILNAGHAIELFLKVALDQRDPESIYTRRNDDSGVGTGIRHTVGYKVAIKLLRQQGVPITDREESDVKVLRRYRDSLEHHALTITQDDVDNAMVRAMRFIDDFLPKFDVNIADVIEDRERFLQFKETIMPARVWLERAEAKAKEDLPWREVARGAKHEVLTCQDCGAEAVLYIEGEDVHRCERCKETYDTVGYCERCGAAVLGGTSDEGLCELCDDNVFRFADDD
jgi:hypothetical protein